MQAHATNCHMSRGWLISLSTWSSKGPKTDRISGHNRLENVGADMNASLPRRSTCVYASFLEQLCRKSYRMLNDILFFSVFSEKEMEKKRMDH
jgi:predicted Zn-dependent peptidase